MSDDLKIEINEKIANLNNDVFLTLKETSKALYNDIKDLSFVIQDNFVELSKAQEKIKEEYQSVIENVSKLNDEKTNEKISNLNDKLDKIALIIEEQRKQNAQDISVLIQKIEENKHQTNAIVSQMKAEFVAILREEQIKHKEEILEFKHQIRELEYDLREEIKSPIKKIVEKYQNKQGK